MKMLSGVLGRKSNKISVVFFGSSLQQAIFTSH